MTYQHLITRRDGAVEYLTLNRPDVRNAFNARLISELASWAANVTTRANSGEIRVVVLAGSGPTFCAGADVTWMSETVQFTTDENLRDAIAASEMFGALNALPIPLVGRVHGGAIGGGAGLAAVCDIVVAEERSVFGFSEVKLGILPAVISPFVLAKIGPSAARELFLTGMRFSANRAHAVGLVHAVVAEPDLDGSVARYIGEVLSAAPEAIAAAKSLIGQVAGRPVEEVRPLTAAAIANRRISAEGQEGLRAFLEKRKPKWSA
jgi:methylglutaconyl-CoA hydratase